jgi:hypothetical protein
MQRDIDLWVIAAFFMKDIIALRAVAQISNIAFLLYGIGLNLVTVWLLHAILLPVNSWRLWQSVSCGCKIMAERDAQGIRICVRLRLPRALRDDGSNRASSIVK